VQTRPKTRLTSIPARCNITPQTNRPASRQANRNFGGMGLCRPFFLSKIHLCFAETPFGERGLTGNDVTPRAKLLIHYGIYFWLKSIARSS
jgi:hypothetical protein